MPAESDGGVRAALERARALQRSGEPAAAIEAFEAAVPGLVLPGIDASLIFAAGVLAQDLGHLERAEELLAEAARRDPRLAGTQAALGQVRMDRGNVAGALAAFEAAVAARPTPRAWNNAGIAALALERRDDALNAFEQALLLDPNYALARFNLARLHAPHDPERALAHAQAAVQADPGIAEAWELLSDLFRRRQDYGNALSAVNVAIERAPQRAAGWTARAALLSELDETSRARDEFSAAWGRFPGDYRAALGACLTLPHVYESHAHLETSRSAYESGLAKLRQAAARFVFPDAETALAQSRWTNFYLAYQGCGDRDLQQRYAEIQRDVLRRAAPQFFEPRARRAGGARLRVGFLSHYFYNAVAGRYFSSWITRLDPARFERIVYYTNSWMADDTRAIAAAADRFRHVAGRPLAAIARQVIDDRLDVLVFPEVGMHPDTATFAAMRLAPVQCMGWGHPTTSGSPEMDWYLSCESMEPEQAQEHYGERLALLPGLGTCYQLPALEGAPQRAEFGLPEDRTLYLAPQSLFKMHPDNDALIASVLAGDPRGVVVLFEAKHERSTHAFRSRLDAALAAAGVAADRVRMLKPGMPHAAYLRLNAACDVMLDSVHWSGGNTSIDAIAAGLPIVTMPGALMRGRQSAAMLHSMGLSELVVNDARDYAATAVRLGTDREWRDHAAAVMRDRRGKLFGQEEPIRALEAFLERVAGS